MPQIQFTNHKRQNLHTTLVHTVHTSHSTIQHSNKKVFTNHKLKQVNHQKKKRKKKKQVPDQSGDHFTNSQLFICHKYNSQIKNDKIYTGPHSTILHSNKKVFTNHKLKQVTDQSDSAKKKVTN